MAVPPTEPVLDLHPATDEPRRYLNRELTWLSFNERVLALADDPQVPLLERAKFVAIYADNLDEFFQVRVAGLMEQQSRGTTSSPPDGMSPTQQLDAIRARVEQQTEMLRAILHDRLLPALAEEGVQILAWEELDGEARTHLSREFEGRVFPVLTPLAVDPAHPFPYISTLSLNLAVEVRDPVTGETRFARVKVPPILPRFVELDGGEGFVPLEEVIEAHLDRLFPGLDIVDCNTFRVTRNADYEIEEDEADDLLQAIETELTRRRFGRVVRLEIEQGMPPATLELLQRELDITDEVIDEVTGPLDLAGMWAVFGLDRGDLKYPGFTPATPPAFAARDGHEPDVFELLRRGDVLVQHPYDSFESTVQTFIESAASDPDVLAIKMTLYRTSGPGSPIVRALLRAAEEGKQVVCLVELKARFDEEANIEWARVLEEAGVHVAYGVVGLKTHTKTALVVRDEGGTINRYAHIGTGNYNDKTAKIYEDLGLLTADEALGADLSDLFNVLTGYSRQSHYRKLLVSPTSFGPRILELVEEETRAGADGRIVMKMNSLVDREHIDALYAASQAGVAVDLVVRGICCLRSGVEGLSENIHVRSIVGRYLEHSRIYRFGTPERGVTTLIGSGDLMPRNLHRRVEAITPVESPVLQERLASILDTLLADDQLAWMQCPDGSWERVPSRQDEPVETHATLQRRAMQEARRGRAVEQDEAGGAVERVRAAGGVVLREHEGAAEVLVVHRPEYDDWSLPKGKLDTGETWRDAASREVTEETGVDVGFGPELAPVHYTDRSGRPKTVRWWLMEPVAGDPEGRPADPEVDEARWVREDDAPTLLSYDSDRTLLSEALARRAGERAPAPDGEVTASSYAEGEAVPAAGPVEDPTADGDIRSPSSTPDAAVGAGPAESP